MADLKRKSFIGFVEDGVPVGRDHVHWPSCEELHSGAPDQVAEVAVKPGEVQRAAMHHLHQPLLQGLCVRNGAGILDQEGPPPSMRGE